MKTTIADPVSPRDVNEKGVLDYLNVELRPFLSAVRASLNIETVQAFTLSTAATATFTNIWTSDPMPTNSAWFVEARVLTFASAGAAQRCAYIRHGLFYNDAGTVAQQGTTTATYSEESAAGADVQLVVDGQTVTLDVKDDGTSTFWWVAVVRLLPTAELVA